MFVTSDIIPVLLYFLRRGKTQWMCGGKKLMFVCKSFQYAYAQIVSDNNSERTTKIA